ncbi:MAG TPA: HWE histidine kinase domain-containing protein [Xanthobacteraceae bacterium]|nr:HWE histidine kinase domain-containing protein [Xanthobacteraceae bacterium]
MWATSEQATTGFDRIVEAHNDAVRKDEKRLQVEPGIDVRRRVEETLRERARRFRELLEALPAAVYTTDAAGRITFYNQTALELWGCRPELGKSEWCGSWRLYWPDGRPMQHDECPMAVALKENRAVRGGEAIAERPDGTRVPFMACPTPLRDGSGVLVGAVNMLVDITHRKQSEERVMMLAGEVVHRANNLLAVVQATVRLTEAETVEGLKEAIHGRIQALGHAHALLALSRWSGAELEQLVEDELAPYRCGQQPRARISGPKLVLDPKAAQSMAMALHELTTNAAKYGALSTPAGEVRIEWRHGPHGRLAFRWAEAGGPAVKPPRRKGFGTSVIVGMIRDQLDGEVRFEWGKEGLVCEIDLPAEKLERLPEISA